MLAIKGGAIIGLADFICFWRKPQIHTSLKFANAMFKHPSVKESDIAYLEK